MKICFNLQNVGLGNNGGSRTLIRSAEALSQLGHEVYMWNPVMKYTWHKPKGLVFTKIEPKSHAIIATGAGSYDSTIKSKNKNKWVWIRGWEIWSQKEKYLIDSYKQLNCIVNSEWLQQKLAKHKIESKIIYPGLDFDKFYDLKKDKKGIGFLWHDRHKTKNHKFAQSVVENIGCYYERLNKDIKNPTESDLNEWYNGFKIWLGTSSLEGLHNPPQEASLAGCSLVCNNHHMNGMNDYAIHNKTALVFQYNNLNQAIRYCEELLNNQEKRRILNYNMKELLRNKIGNRKKNMKKFIDLLK